MAAAQAAAQQPRCAAAHLQQPAAMGVAGASWQQGGSAVAALVVAMVQMWMAALTVAVLGVGLSRPAPGWRLAA